MTPFEEVEESAGVVLAGGWRRGGQTEVRLISCMDNAWKIYWEGHAHGLHIGRSEPDPVELSEGCLQRDTEYL